MDTFKNVLLRQDGSYVIDKNDLPYHVPNEGEYAPLWAEVDAWAQEHPADVRPEPEPEPPAPEEQRAAALARIDAQTTAAILAGFDYEIEGETLHFSYDHNDQQNFADTANAATLALMGLPGIPDAVTWNGWRIERDAAGAVLSRSLRRLSLSPQSFLALYMNGALVHKAARMEEGGRAKAALEAEYAPAP